jgi:hypothetical protein
MAWYGSSSNSKKKKTTQKKEKVSTTNVQEKVMGTAMVRIVETKKDIIFKSKEPFQMEDMKEETEPVKIIKEEIKPIEPIKIVEATVTEIPIAVKEILPVIETPVEVKAPVIEKVIPVKIVVEENIIEPVIPEIIPEIIEESKIEVPEVIQITNVEEVVPSITPIEEPVEKDLNPLDLINKANLPDDAEIVLTEEELKSMLSKIEMNVKESIVMGEVGYTEPIFPIDSKAEKFRQLSKKPFELRYKGIKIFDSYTNKRKVQFEFTHVFVGDRKYPYQNLTILNK